MCDFCKLFDIWEYRLDKLVEEVMERDICFREKKMGKTRGRLPNVRGRERVCPCAHIRESESERDSVCAG